MVFAALFAALLMALIWAVQQRTADAGIVDVGWAAGIGVLALAYAYTGSGLDQRRLLVGLLGGIWSFRLSTYLIIDRVRAKAEDGRYRMLRQSWSDRAPLYFFLFFQAQALLVVIFSLPFFLAAQNPTILSLWDGLGVFIFAIALLGESVADRQLARFRRDPHNSGKTCRTGLWYYSRHPNYFCEWLHWWSYVPIAFGASWGLLSLAGPIAMLFLLYFVTGIPYNEKQAIASRGNEYRAYQRSTSAFFPWFPRKDIS